MARVGYARQFGRPEPGSPVGKVEALRQALLGAA